MSSTVHISAAWLVMTAVAAIFAIALPLTAGGIARRKLTIGWKYFWFGALVFLVFQLLTRVPAVLVLQQMVLAPLLRSSTTLVWIWLAVLAVTAGLFEEIGRYAGYRLFMGREPKTWSKAVMFGLGHEGLESMVLVGGGLLLTLLKLTFQPLSSLGNLPADQRHAILQQLTAIQAQPFWLPLLSAWERLWSFPLQVAFSVLVLQVFRRGQVRWLFLAILFHALVDFMAVGLPQAFGHGVAIKLVVEGMVCVFGLLGVWIIGIFREPGA